MGSWLSAWRLHQGFPQIWEQLIRRPKGPDFEPVRLSWLRSYTNFLTPKIGIASDDTWTPIVLWLRNLLLNWLVIIPPICVLVLGLKLLALTSNWVILWSVATHWQPQEGAINWKVYTRAIIECSFGIAALFCLARALAFATRNRPSCRLPDECGPDQLQILRGYVLWSLLSAFLLINFLASDLVGNLLLECTDSWNRLGFTFCKEHDIAHDHGWNIARYPIIMYLIVSAGVGAAIYWAGWCRVRPQKRDPLDLLMWTISGASYGAIIGFGVYFYLIVPDLGVLDYQLYFLHFVFGVPWILGAQLVADMIFAGLSSYEADSDADREWLGRVASWILVVAVAWLVLTYLVFLEHCYADGFLLPKSPRWKNGYP
jgi:hypothetical protein